MRSSALILVLFTLIAFQAGCTSKPAANAEVNAAANVPAGEAVTESSFGYITDPYAALAEGNRLLDDNQTEQAIEALKRAVALDPNLAEAHFKLGIAYALTEAEAKQSGVDINPTENTKSKKDPPKSNSEKEFEKAVAAYKKLLAKSPKDDVAQFNLGRAYNKLNQDDDAEEAFRAAVKLKPEDTEYQTELGAILIKLAQYHEAIPSLKKALELDGDNLRADKLLEDAEAGAKRVDYKQPDKGEKDKKSSADDEGNGNSNSNANTTSGNTAVKPGNSNTKIRKDEPRDNRFDKPGTKPGDRHR